MKCVFICLLFVGLSVAKPQNRELPWAKPTEDYSRGCIYVEGRCSEGCPVGTHGYTTGCGHLTPEATCKNPTPVQDKSSVICDYSNCYCDSPTVRDEKTGKCVPLDQCT